MGFYHQDVRFHLVNTHEEAMAVLCVLFLQWTYHQSGQRCYKNHHYCQLKAKTEKEKTHNFVVVQASLVLAT